MNRIRNVFLLFLVVSLSGCTVVRGPFDFAQPVFDVKLGRAAIMCFPTSTVFQYGTTHLIISVPWYLLVAGFLVVALAIWVVIKKRRRENVA